MQFALSVAARRAVIGAVVLASVATGAVAHEVKRARAPLVPRVLDAYPGQLVAVGPEDTWAVACQARHDTNGDGVVDRTDAKALYVFPDARSDGEWIGSIETQSTDGRWLVAGSGGAGGLRVVDLSSGDQQVVPVADVQRRGRRAKIDRAAERLVYFRGEQSPALVVRRLETGVEQTFELGRDVEYFEIQDGPWIALRFRRAEDDRAWAPHAAEPCQPATTLAEGPSEPDAWLDTTSGAIADARPSMRP
ncbi:MAG TPA: hypothetical protein VGC42_11775 [Kofleriaceae bacterium]